MVRVRDSADLSVGSRRDRWLRRGSPTTVTTSTQPSTPHAETVTNAPIATEPDSPASGVELIASTLQLDLQKLGYDSGPIGTDFSSVTRAALKRFQSSAEVAGPEHGALGPSTADALSSRLQGATDVVTALQSALTMWTCSRA